MKLIKEFGYSQKKVCKKLGKNDIYVRTRLKLLALPETIQKAVIQEKLSISQAAPLAELSTSEEQEKAAREIISSSLTGHDVKELVAMKRKRAMGRADSSRAKIWIWKELDLHARKVIEILADTESPTKFSFGNREDLEVILLKLKKAIEKTLRQLKDASQED